MNHDQFAEQSPKVNVISPQNYPADSVIERVAFVPRNSQDKDLLLELPAPLQHKVVRLTQSGSTETGTTNQILILTIPIIQGESTTNPEHSSLDTLKNWVDEGAANTNVVSHLMTFQGVQICWSPKRFAIMAVPARLQTIRNSLLEISYFEWELNTIEEDLGQEWPHLEADLPLAFHFDEKSLKYRQQLMGRYLQVLKFRARLARIGPYIHSPHSYPPTLASQLSERLRERTRMMHRHEFLGEQVEVFEEVYDSCGQRSSDYLNTRSGNILEWVIIVILLIQTLFHIVEIMASSSTITNA